VQNSQSVENFCGQNAGEHRDYPAEGFELKSFPPKGMNSSPIGRFYLVKLRVFMQSAKANHVKTFESKEDPIERTGSSYILQLRVQLHATHDKL
jgi:hypothetical protein